MSDSSTRKVDHSLVDGLLLLHDDPGLPVGGELGHEGVVDENLVLLEHVAVDGHDDLATNEVVGVVGLDRHGIGRELDEGLSRAANDVARRERCGVLVNDELLLGLGERLNSGLIRKSDAVELHLRRVSLSCILPLGAHSHLH